MLVAVSDRDIGFLYGDGVMWEKITVDQDKLFAISDSDDSFYGENLQ